MGLLLSLISPGNDEHGRSVCGSNSDRSGHNTRGSTFLGRGLVVRIALAAEWIGRGVGCIRGYTRIPTRTAIISRAERDVDSAVDLHREVLDNLVRVRVQS